MKKLTAILFVCFVSIPFVAQGATDYTACEIMVTARSHFDITNQAQIFQDNPEYKTEFENNKNNPLSRPYDVEYKTGVGCVAKCSAGQKLSDCVTPDRYRDDCVNIFAFDMLKSKYEKQWIENKIKKECGENPAKKDSNGSSTPITEAFVVVDSNNKGIANCEVRKLSSVNDDCASSTGDLACRTNDDGKCDFTSPAVAYGVFCGNRCKTVRRAGAIQPANTANTYLHRVVMNNDAKTIVDTSAIAKAKQEFIKNMNVLHSAYENKLKKLQSKATK